jgi:hypothetical protein
VIKLKNKISRIMYTVLDLEEWGILDNFYLI